METIPNPFTKEEMLNELKGILLALGDSMARVYTEEGGWGLLGYKDKPKNKTYVVDLDPEDVDISSYKITGVMDVLYDYAINAQWDTKTDDWIDLVTDTEAFFLGITHFPLLDESGIHYSFKLCTYVLELATARWLLDEEGNMPDFVPVEGGIRTNFLTLGQVALLANMEEKSVRNAANPKVKNPLKTFSYAGRTYVDRNDAIEWLKKRRGFKPTVFFDSRARTGEIKKGFWSIGEVGRFVKARRETLGITDKSLAATANLQGGVDRLAQIEEGNFAFKKEEAVALAKALNLDMEQFTLAVLKAFQQEEFNAIRHELSEERWNELANDENS